MNGPGPVGEPTVNAYLDSEKPQIGLYISRGEQIKIKTKSTNVWHAGGIQ